MLLRQDSYFRSGFQYHHGEAVWGQFSAGQSIDLMREVDNQCDMRAVRLGWQGHKLGYLSRLGNVAVSRLLGRGEPLSCVITRLQESKDPWARMEVEVRWAI